MAVLVTGGGYVLLLLADKPDIPADLWLFLAAVLGLYLVAHLAVRRFAPRADPTLLPIAFILNGIGFVTISRLDRDLARGAGGVDRRRRRRIRPHAGRRAPGPHARALPLHVPAHRRRRAAAPAAARASGGRSTARACGCGVGPVNFQPGEAAKVLLVIFFAAYLVDKRELLAAGSRRIGRLMVPDPKHLGPLLLAWGVSILVMVRQKDLGSSLLFFAVFAAMLYIATERAGVPRRRVRHVRRSARRSRTSSSPTCTTACRAGPTRGRSRRRRATSSCSRCSRSAPAASRAPGSASGARRRSPTRRPTSCSRRSARSSGCIGTVAICMLFLLFVGSGFRIAIQAERPFSKLFAAGLTTIVGVQTFVIIGGVIRVIPLTGVTLAVRVVRRVVARRQLRARRAAAAHLRRDGRAAGDAAAGRDRAHGRARRRRRAARASRPVNRAIRRVGIAVSVLILVLVAQLTYLQVVDADNLENNPLNVRTLLDDFNRPRGQILTADGAIVADVGRRRTAATSSTSARTRSPDLFAQISRLPVVRRRQHRRRGELRQRVLTGRDAACSSSDLGGCCHRARTTPATSCSRSRRRRSRPRPTRSAARRGAVVAHRHEDRRDRGDVLEPDVRPERRWPVTTRDGRAGHVQRDQLTATKPALPRTYREIYPPGSSFKIITSAAALDTGLATPVDPVYPVVDRSRCPQTGQRVSNFGGEFCGGNLTESLVHSCNTTFGQIGLDLGNAFVPAINNCGVGVGRAAARPLPVRSGAPGRRRVVRRQPARLRQGRDRPAGRRGHAARDGARGRGHRQRRRDHGAARGARDPGLRRRDGEDRSRTSRGRRASRRRTAARSPT